MPKVSDYYPGDFWRDVNQTLTWLLARQNAPVGNWQGNAVATPPSQAKQFAESGIISVADLTAGAAALVGGGLSALENIVIDTPVGVPPDGQTGPDGFPINFSPQGLPTGNLFLNIWWIAASTTMAGRCFSLVQALANYRVDVFTKTDVFYYKGSSTLTDAGGGVATWSVPVTIVNPAPFIAVLYPTSVVQPVVGSFSSTIPAGWLAHSNMGVGQKLSNFKAQFFSKTDIEYLQEDSIPIIVQDSHHARAGSSVIPGAGTLTMHILYNDPVSGWTQVFSTLQNLAVFRDLPRGLDVPTSDPLYAPDPTKVTVAVVQNRSWIYDAALGIITYIAAGNFFAASRIIKQLNFFLDNPSYLASLILENAEDGLTTRWTSSDVNSTITNLNDPTEPPYGTGNVIKFHSAALGDSFTYAGAGFPDATDTMIQWQHRESSVAPFVFTIGVTGAGGNVAEVDVISNLLATTAPTLAQVPGGALAAATYYVKFTWTTPTGESLPSAEVNLAVAANNLLQVTPPAAPVGATGWNVYVSTATGNETNQNGSTPLALGTAWTEPTTGLIVGSNPPATDTTQSTATFFNSTTKQIIVTVGLGLDKYRWVLLNLSNLISTLASDTLKSITSFKVTINAAGADLYIDNLSVGTLQPTGSLSFSYDVYNGAIDQAYIRTGAMAWVCYAYALYMQMSLDYTPATYLQSMLNFLLTLKVTASGSLRTNLYQLGYGQYSDPGYQFNPGLRTSCSIEHNIDLYFAWLRASKVLPTAAIQLLKAGRITNAIATSLNTLATTASTEVTSIAAALFAVPYIPPTATAAARSTAYAVGAKVQDSNSNIQCCIVAGTSGTTAPGWATALNSNTADGAVTWQLVNLAGTPGHYSQGVTTTNLDISQALDASGTWASEFSHAAGDDTRATECIKFVYQNFYLIGQTIVKSSATATFNQAYQQLTPFSGCKPFNDSVGGYSGSPASVWQEGTWGFIHALLRLYSVSGIATYIASVQTSLDAFLTKLITDQRVVRSTIGNGSLLNFSLASRGLPFEFSVWAGLSSTAWFWITAINPSLLFASDTSTNIESITLPFLYIPQGQSQSVLDREGHSSIGTLDVESIDPVGVVKGLVAQTNLVGKVARLRMGFPGQALGDFVALSTVQIVSTGWTADGRVKISCADLQRFLKEHIFQNGGPGAWLPGQPATLQPFGATWLANSQPTSGTNPRWLSGNPLDIYLAVMQNELGVGQDPTLPSSAWALYVPGQDSTLINPNLYLDVPGILALRNGAFSGDWFEFKITRPIEAKQWLDDQIMKILGLYTIVGADGRMRLKSMKSPQAASPVMALNERNVMGIPDADRLPVVNVVTVRFGQDVNAAETAAIQYAQEITFQQATSISQYKQQFKTQIEANGLTPTHGGNLRAFLVADRIFKRYAFGTPRYKVKAQLLALIVELGDFVWLNHPNVIDFQSGTIGLSNVVCEVIGRQPNYQDGYVEFELLDTRFMALTKPFQIARITDNIPVYSKASAAQRAQYEYISLAASGGLNSDGTPGSTVF